MTIYEISSRRSFEHRRMIRNMTRDAFWIGKMPMNPRVAALIEIAIGTVIGSAIALTVRLFVWRLTGL